MQHSMQLSDDSYVFSDQEFQFQPLLSVHVNVEGSGRNDLSM